MKESEFTTIIKNFEVCTTGSQKKRQIELGNPKKRLDIFTVAKYNFEKYGLMLSKQESQKMFIMRKERHFVDFSKFPKSD